MTTTSSQPARDGAPGPGYWKASDGNWYPPETHPGYRRPAFAKPPPWGSSPAGPSPGVHRSPRLVFVLVLACVWMVVVLVPMVFTVVTGDFLAGSAVTAGILMGAFEVMLAISAGYTFRRHGTRPQLAVATVFGALSLGIAASVGVLTASDYSGDPPWGAVLLVNVLVNGFAVFIAVSAGQGLAALLERRHHGTGHI